MWLTHNPDNAFNATDSIYLPSSIITTASMSSMINYKYYAFNERREMHSGLPFYYNYLSKMYLELLTEFPASNDKKYL